MTEDIGARIAALPRYTAGAGFGITGDPSGRWISRAEAMAILDLCNLCGHPKPRHANPGSECVVSGCDCDGVP